MQQWQQSEDSAQALMSLPHLRLGDVPQTVAPVQTQPGEVNGVRTLHVSGDTNGIVYLNLYFDVSDLTDEELCMLNVLSTCFGELRTETCSADVLQNRVKALLGSLFLRVDCLQKQGDTEHVHPYLLVSASMLEENAAEAVQLLRELLTQGCYDETDRIGETVMQNDYFMRQSLISNGHTFAVTKSLSAFSAGAALKETLEGETFVRWFAALAAGFAQNGTQVSAALRTLTERCSSRAASSQAIPARSMPVCLHSSSLRCRRARSARRLRTSAMTRPPVRSRSRRMWASARWDTTSTPSAAAIPARARCCPHL